MSKHEKLSERQFHIEVVYSIVLAGFTIFVGISLLYMKVADILIKVAELFN